LKCFQSSSVSSGLSKEGDDVSAPPPAPAVPPPAPAVAAALQALPALAVIQRRIAQNKFLKEKEATPKIQAVIRRRIAQNNFLKKKEATPKIQAVIRRRIAQNNFLKKKEATTKIQVAYRGHVARRSQDKFLKGITQFKRNLNPSLPSSFSGFSAPIDSLKRPVGTEYPQHFGSPKDIQDGISALGESIEIRTVSEYIQLAKLYQTYLSETQPLGDLKIEGLKQWIERAEQEETLYHARMPKLLHWFAPVLTPIANGLFQLLASLETKDVDTSPPPDRVEESVIPKGDRIDNWVFDWLADCTPTHQKMSPDSTMKQSLQPSVRWEKVKEEKVKEQSIETDFICSEQSTESHKSNPSARSITGDASTLQVNRLSTYREQIIEAILSKALPNAENKVALHNLMAYETEAKSDLLDIISVIEDLPEPTNYSRYVEETLKQKHPELYSTT